jgi:beta-xylosidase
MRRRNCCCLTICYNIDESNSQQDMLRGTGTIFFIGLNFNEASMAALDNTLKSGNPIIRHTYTADPTVLEYNGTVYLYTGHDEAPPGEHRYIMNKWLCFSSQDLIHWTEHPVNFKAIDFKWAKGDAYASNVIERHGKFYWYTAVTHGTLPGKAIGVAVADSPVGPFTDVIGSALITSQVDGMLPDTDNFDPSVLIDDDGQAYIFWGKNVCYYARLHKNMIALHGPVKSIALPKFMEGAHIRKRNGWYYLSYGYDFPEKVAYAMSRQIDGPWEFKGILNEIAGNCETNRPAIIDFKGKSYFFYHNGGLKEGGSHRRSVCLDYLYYNNDDTMQRVVMTSEGVEPA